MVCLLFRASVSTSDQVRRRGKYVANERILMYGRRSHIQDVDDYSLKIPMLGHSNRLTGLSLFSRTI